MPKQLFAVLVTAVVIMAACGPSSKTQIVQGKQPQLRLPDPPKSEVLDLLEKNGAGDMSKSSLAAEQVVKMCEPIEQHATVSWGDSAEATACTAAHETSITARRAKAWTFTPPVADKRAW